MLKAFFHVFQLVHNLFLLLLEGPYFLVMFNIEAVVLTCFHAQLFLKVPLFSFVLTKLGKRDRWKCIAVSFNVFKISFKFDAKTHRV